MSRWPKEIQGLAYSGESAAQQGFHEHRFEMGMVIGFGSYESYL